MAVQNESDEENIKQTNDVQIIDWYLQSLVDMANRHNIEMGITLVLGGSTVSGTLVSGKRYFEEFSKEFSNAWPDNESKELIREHFANYAKIYDSPENDKDERPPLPQYIHLKNSKIHSPSGSLPANMGVLWRGRISAVSGFSLGSLNS